MQALGARRAHPGAAKLPERIQTNREAQMKRTLYAAGAAILAASLVVAHAQTSSTPSTSHSGSAAKKHAPAKKPAAPPAPSVEDQIQALRTEMQTQIDS